MTSSTKPAASSNLPATAPSSAPSRADIQAARRSGLTAEAQSMLDERRAINVMSQEIANLSWGKGMSDGARRSIAEYCRRFGIDAATEIDILGGKIYRNSQFFIRKGVELRTRGKIANVTVEHINVDKRLDALAQGTDEHAMRAQDEIRRRTWFRVQYNIPDEAKGAVLITILPTVGASVVGANYAGSFGNRKDPVGDEHPGKTAESRAYRRAWRHLIDTMPDLRAEMGEIEEEGKSLSAVVIGLSEDEARRESEAKIDPKPLAALNAANPLDPYGVDEPAAPVRREGDPWDEAATDEELQRADQKLVERETQGGLGIADKKPNRSPQSQGR